MALISSGLSYDRISAGTTAQRPALAAGDAGSLRFNTDTSFLEQWNGTAWGSVSPSSGGGVTVGPTAPSGPIEGDLWYNTNDSRLYSAVNNVGGTPVWVDASPDSQNIFWDRDTTNGILSPLNTSDDLSIGGDATVSGTTTSGTLSVTGDATMASQNGGQLAGFRNVVINGDLVINQRGVSITSAATGSYGEDRWKKTAGGMTQIIEDGNYEPSSTYTLSGTGITTTQITSPASGDWTLPDISTSARKIQLEPGPVATPFEQRPVGLEQVLCQRYYQTLPFYLGDYMNPASTYNPTYTFSLGIRLRSVPTLSFIDIIGQGGIASLNQGASNATSELLKVVVGTEGGVGAWVVSARGIMDAEL